jgi:diaminopimelate decarboxylase
MKHVISEACMEMARRLAEESSQGSWDSFYLYDLPGIQANAGMAFKESNGSTVSIFYACKANPNPEVLTTIKNAGLGVEISTPGELRWVTEVGFDPKKIIVTGPAKVESFIRQCIEAGVCNFVAESPHIYAMIIGAANFLSPKKPISVFARLQLPTEAGVLKEGPLEGASHLGAPIEEWRQVKCWETKHVHFAGLQVFYWNNIADIELLCRYWERSAQAASDFCAEFGLAPGILDVGGGIGIEMDGTSPSWAECVSNLSKIGEHHGFSEIYFEPGRLLVGGYGLYATPILDRKKSANGTEILVVGGGITHFARYALHGRTGASVPFYRNQSRRGQNIECVVYGAASVKSDSLGVMEISESVKIGDWVMYTQVGGYGQTQAMPHFMSGKAAYTECFKRGVRL